MIRAKLPGGTYPYLPAVVSLNGKIKQGVALLNGVETKVEGSYYIRFTEGGKRRLVGVGDNAAEARAAAEKKVRELKLAREARALGIAVPAVNPTLTALAAPNRIKLADAIQEYKAEIKEHKAPRTYVAYAYALDLFAAGCKKTYVDEIQRPCFMRFKEAMKKERNDTTVKNLLRYVYTFLKRYGKTGILNKTDWPKVEHIEYEIYSDEDIEKMLAACESLEERALILFAKGTGFRHGEIKHAQVGDIDFAAGTIQTRSKPEFGFKTKDCEQRIVPVNDALIAVLKKHVATLDGTLLFPTREGNPDKNLGEALKKIARRAGVKLPRKPMHAWRVHYATHLIRAGADIYTVQKLLGHSDIETTQGYLRAVKRDDPRLREQINAAAG